MTYQVLARKWRPTHFDTVVGQHIPIQILKNALSEKDCYHHHAYLFTGTHGVGKTTIARILAKCLSCLKGPTATPCGQCKPCQDIQSGTYTDFIEIDAASRTKVEDIRELLENLPYAPSQGKFKIYLIDEMHMLSTHAFNALLKSLEEPPAHIIFLLATTDPQKLPPTILSRCLRLHLHKLSPDVIAQHFAALLKAENVSFEQAALFSLAEAAEGSLRDGLSLLDQSISYSRRHITIDKVHTMLGMTDQASLHKLLSALIEHPDPKTLLDITAHLYEQGTDFEKLLADIIHILHKIALLHALEKDPQKVHGLNSQQQSSDSINAQIEKYATLLTPEALQHIYQTALKGREELSLAPTPLIGFEMLLLRILSLQQPRVTVKQANPTSHAPTPQTVHPTAKKNDAFLPPKNTDDSNPPMITAQNWGPLLKKLSITGIAHTILEQSSFQNYENNVLSLRLPKPYYPLLSESQKAYINNSLSKYFNTSLKIIFQPLEDQTIESSTSTPNSKTHRHSAPTAHSNPNVQHLLDVFQGKVIE